MVDDLVNRAHIRRILILIILATLPCYFIGLVYVWVKPVFKSSTATLAPTSTVTSTPSVTPIIPTLYPSAIIQATLTNTPMLLTTLFISPTDSLLDFHTYTPVPTLTSTPTSTMTASVTASMISQPIPTDTVTLSPSPASTTQAEATLTSPEQIVPDQSIITPTP